MKWWHEKDHPIWRIALVAVACIGLAYLGADNLDPKDIAAVMAGAGAQWAFGPKKS